MHRGGLVYICMHPMLWYNFYQQVYGDNEEQKQNVYFN